MLVLSQSSKQLRAAQCFSNQAGYCSNTGNTHNVSMFNQVGLLNQTTHAAWYDTNTTALKELAVSGSSQSHVACTQDPSTVAAHNKDKTPDKQVPDVAVHPTAAQHGTPHSARTTQHTLLPGPQCAANMRLASTTKSRQPARLPPIPDTTTQPQPQHSVAVYVLLSIY